MKQMKKLLSLLLAFSLVLGVCGGLLLTARADGTYDGFVYEEHSDGVAVTDYNGSDTTITVPAEINGKPVVSIDEHAFAYFYNVEAITLPDTVTSIGDYAFAYSTFRTIDLGKGVQSIADFAFQDCADLEQLILGAEIGSVGLNAFRNAGANTDDGLTLYAPAGLSFNIYDDQHVYTYEPLVTCGKTTYVKITDDGNTTAETISCEIGEGYEAIASEDPDLTIDLGMELDSWSSHPFQIGTYAQLRRFSVYENFVDPSACAHLCQDIVAEDDAWLPIGSVLGSSFEGEFCGYSLAYGENPKYYTITGLSSAQTPDAYRCTLGLFGNIASRGYVEGVGLCNTTFISDEAYARVAGIAAVNNGTVDSCYCFGTTALRSTGADGYVGGIVAKNAGDVERCFVTGYATIEGSATSAAGGLVGMHDGTLQNSYYAASGSIRGSYAGGLAGTAPSGVMKDCFSYGAATIRSIENDSPFTVATRYAGQIAGVITHLGGEDVFFSDDHPDPERPTGPDKQPEFIKSIRFSNLRVAQVTFSNSFDFSNIWYMGEKYPELQFAKGCVPEGWNTGDVIHYGSYPQTRVTDAATIAALEETFVNEGLSVNTFNYYAGYDGVDETILQGEMNYCDMLYNGVKYRRVYIERCRVRDTRLTIDLNNSYQDENGYLSYYDDAHYPRGVYWFRYEPLRWRVLDPDTGLVMCESIIDSQPFNEYATSNGADVYGAPLVWGNMGQNYYASDYRYSSIRAWLNHDFMYTAFTEAQRDGIAATTLDNSLGKVYEDRPLSETIYDYSSTTDSVYLLSLEDARNDAYDFTQPVRGSDYAKCQGLGVSADGSSDWLLRTAAETSDALWYVGADGKAAHAVQTTNTSLGIRPVMTLKELKIDAAIDTRIAPSIVICIDDVTYNRKAVAVITVSDDANGMVSVTVEGSGTETYTYEGTVSYGVASVDLTDLPPDFYIATVNFYSGEYVDDAESPTGKTFVRDDLFAPSVGSYMFAVNRVPVEMSYWFEPGLLYAGSPYTVYILLNDEEAFDDPPEQTLFSGGSATLYIDGARYASVSDIADSGSFSVVMPNAGYHSFKIVYDGDGFHLPCVEEFGVTVENPTALESFVLECADYRVGETAEFRAELPLDAMGTVTFTISAIREGGSVVVKEIENVPLEDGVAKASTAELPAGEYQVIAAYNGYNYTAGTAQGDFTITLHQSYITIALEKDHVSVGESAVVSIEIPENAGVDPRSAGNVSVLLNGEELQTITVENGKGQYTIPSLNAGTYTITAVFNGDAQYYCASTSDPLTLVVENNATSIALGITPDDVIEYGDTVTFTATLSGDKDPTFVADTQVPAGGNDTGVDGGVTIIVDVKPYYTVAAQTGDPVITLSGNVATLALTGLTAGDHTVKVVYRGDAANDGSDAETTFKVEKGKPAIDVTYTPANEDMTAIQLTITKPLDAVDGVSVEVLHAEYKSSTTSIDANQFENGQYVLSFPECFGDLYKKPGIYKFIVTYYGETDPNYHVADQELWVTLNCAHEWKEPVWNWEDDVNNPTYSAECNNCTDKAEGSVASVPGTRVDATVDDDAYTPYTAQVTLGTQTFSSSYKDYEPGTMQAAREQAFNDYKATLIETVNSYGQAGDSEKVQALIAAAADAISGVDYDPNISLEDNYAAADQAADLDALTKAVTDQRAADAVEAKINAIGEVEYTPECKAKIDDAVGARDALTPDQLGLLSDDAAVTLRNAIKAYQQLEDAVSFDDYKEAKKAEADAKALEGDSEKAAALITAAKKAIDDVTYNENISLDENKQAVDTAANLAGLDAALADQRAADAVEKAISDIGEVEYTDESKRRIDAARAAYDDLTDTQKTLVENIDTLTDAEADYALLESKAAFEDYKDAVKAAADALGQAGDSAQSAALIENAKKAVDELTYDESRSLDENKQAVDDAANLQQLTAGLDDQRAADAVEALIDDIGDVALTDECRDKIDTARAAYDALTPEQQALVENPDVLTAAEQEYADRQAFEDYKDEVAAAAEDKALDGDSAESTALIDAVKDAVNAMTYDDTKPLAENKQAVDDAANLQQLDKDLTDQRAADAVEAKIDAIGDVELTDECRDKIDAAREAYDALTEEQKALVENPDVLTAAEQEYADREAFEEYKEEKKAELDALAKEGDSTAAQQIIEDTKAEIDAMEYDDTKSLEENKKDADAVVADTEKTIENQRTADCPLCGKGHENGFFDKLLGFFHKVLYYIYHYGCLAINIICQIIMKL